MRTTSLPDGDPRHGTPNGYWHHRCRCEACKDAHRVDGLRRAEEAARQGLAEDDPRHGTHIAYKDFKCRCALCVESERKRQRPYQEQVTIEQSREYQARFKERARQQELSPDDPRHGTANFYMNYGCRCAVCKQGQSERQKLYRAKARAAKQQEKR